MLIDLHSANFLCLQKVTMCLLLSTLSDDHGHGAKIEDDSRMHLHHNTKLTNFRKITRKPISTSSSPNEKKIPKCKTHLSTLTQSTHSLCHDPPVVAPCHYCHKLYRCLSTQRVTLQLSWSEIGSEIDLIDILFPELESAAPSSQNGAHLVAEDFLTFFY